jgi:putative transposase
MFERVVRTSGIEVIHTAYEAPRANTICERFVGSMRRECLDHMLVIGELQLIRVLKEYVAYFNPARPTTGSRNASRRQGCRHLGRRRQAG